MREDRDEGGRRGLQEFRSVPLPADVDLVNVVTDWLFRGGLLLALPMGLLAAILRPGAGVIDGRTLRVLLPSVCAVAMTMAVTALVYDHARLVRWFIG